MLSICILFLLISAGFLSNLHHQLAPPLAPSLTAGKKTPTLPPRVQTEQYFSIIHNIFWEIIKMLLEDKKFFICGNIDPEPVNCHPILEAGYIMIKDE